MGSSSRTSRLRGKAVDDFRLINGSNGTFMIGFSRAEEHAHAKNAARAIEAAAALIHMLTRRLSDEERGALLGYRRTTKATRGLRKAKRAFDDAHGRWVQPCFTFAKQRRERKR